MQWLIETNVNDEKRFYQNSIFPHHTKKETEKLVKESNETDLKIWSNEL